MISINLYLAGYVSKHGTQQVKASACWDNNRLFIDTKIRVEAKFWDTAKQRVRKSDPKSFVLNKVLDNIKDVIQHCYDTFLLDGVMYPTEEQMREVYNKTVAKVSNKVDAVEELFNSFCAEKLLTCIPETVDHYRVAYAHLKECCRQNNISFALNNMSLSVYYKYVAYLYEKGQIQNSVGKHVRHMKTFFKYASDNGTNVHKEWNKWKKVSEPVTNISLSQEEVDSIVRLDLSNLPGLANARRLFLLEIFTGLRYSDAVRVVAENLIGDKLVITTKKTKDPIVIPLTAKALEIVKDIAHSKYAISVQKLNENIKELCRRAGIDTTIQKVRHSGTKRIERNQYKWELVTSHTGRRTFVTLSLQKGMRPEVLMKITGHKDVKTLMNYVNITSDVVEKEIKKAWEG